MKPLYLTLEQICKIIIDHFFVVPFQFLDISVFMFLRVHNLKKYIKCIFSTLSKYKPNNVSRMLEATEKFGFNM